MIDDIQSGFIEGRNILNDPLIINEIYSWAKKENRKAFLFKVNFDKTFDSISWHFLDSIMFQMGFGNRWRFWVRSCHSSSQASMLINGSPTSEFPISKGVLQGHPLSPFLFILALEGLNVSMKSAYQRSLFRGNETLNNGPSISHLFYANDAIFVGHWSSSNFINLSRILRCFIVSGLKVNFHKSHVRGIGVPDTEVASCVDILGCEEASFPFTYLGVPIRANMALKRN